jgi:hypothetical protein
MIAPAEKCEWVFGRVVATAPRGVVLVDVLLAVEASESEVLGMRVTAVERGAPPLTETEAAVADTVADAMRDAPPPGLIRPRTKISPVRLGQSWEPTRRSSWRPPRR